VDISKDGPQVIISNQDIAIGSDCVVEYGYYYEYKHTPVLLGWLKGLNMIMPKLKGFK
jgi:hypothetical protein